MALQGEGEGEEGGERVGGDGGLGREGETEVVVLLRAVGKGDGGHGGDGRGEYLLVHVLDVGGGNGAGAGAGEGGGGGGARDDAGLAAEGRGGEKEQENIGSHAWLERDGDRWSQTTRPDWQICGLEDGSN